LARGRARGRGVLARPVVAGPLAPAQTSDFVFVSRVGLLGVGLRVPELVELPGLLDERSAVLLALLPE
jgi:hypothetical protein